MKAHLLTLKSWGLCSAMLLLALSGCGGATSSGTSSSSGGSTSSGGTPELTSVSDLPEATGPVDSSSTSSLVTGTPLSLATTGMPIGSTTSDDFDETTSLAACEMFNMTKGAIQNAAQGDLIQCYFTTALDAYIALRAANGDPTIDFYDGADHVLALDFSGAGEGGGSDTSADESSGEGPGGGDGGPEQVTFSITKAAGVITGFTMHACGAGVQEHYISQTIDGSDFNMTAAGGFESADMTNMFRTTVTGTLNSSNHFSGTKQIHMQFLSASTDTSNWADMTFNQMTDSATLDGYMSGTVMDASVGSFTFSDQVTGSMQLLDANAADAGADYDIGLLALGDGAVAGHTEGTAIASSSLMALSVETAPSDWSHDFTEGWSGDTRLDDPTSAFLDELADLGTPPSEVTSDTLAFTADEDTDCSATPEGTVVFADLAAANGGDDLISSCASLEMDYGWINCWSKSGQGGGGEGGGGGGGGDSTCTETSECSDYGSNAICAIQQGTSSGHCTITCTTDEECTELSSNLSCTTTNLGNVCIPPPM